MIHHLSTLDGRVSVYAQHVPTGRDVAINADEVMNTASVIKLPIMILAYRDAERIHQMKLVLSVYHHNVTPRHGAMQAHQPLWHAAKRLTQEALKTPLSKVAEHAIAAGKPWQSTVKAATLELTRDDWPSGKGYELHFLIRLAERPP